MDTENISLVTDDLYNFHPNKYTRIIQFNSPENIKYGKNHVSTTKYSIWNFLPKFIYEQILKVSNLFFLLMIFVQCLPGVEEIKKYTSIIPLTFIIMISLVKEIIEDIRRRSYDVKINDSLASVMKWVWEKVKWQDILVGELVLLSNKEIVPADILILSTSNKQSICFIETSNLDGETNYKIKSAVKGIPTLTTCREFRQANISIVYDIPNNDLYDFKGCLKYNDSLIDLNSDNLILRGSQVRCTDWVIGVTLYNGRDTKIMKNSLIRPIKLSKMDRNINIILLVIMFIMIIITSIMTTIHEFYNRLYYKDHWYLFDNKGQFYDIFSTFLNFFILLHNFIPVSLVVMLETIKSITSFRINQDNRMYDPITAKYANVKTSGILEQLGQVNYIFSDKTGTLTKNKMSLKGLSINGVIYDFNKDSERECLKLKDPAFELMFTHILLCNSVMPDDPDVNKIERMKGSIVNTNHQIFLNSSSPDEIALVTGIGTLGYIFISRTHQKVAFSIMNSYESWEVLEIFEFDSFRKRMSVIVKNKNGQIFLFCKGADDIILDLLDKDSINNIVEKTLSHLDAFVNRGLRTLCFAYKQIDAFEYQNWKEQIEILKKQGLTKKEDLEKLQNALEKDLILLGASGIEDELQDDVRDSIRSIKMAKIRIWLLTGDKLETAINIGHSTSIIEPSSEVIVINELNAEEIEQKLIKIYKDKSLVVEVAKNGKRYIPLELPHDISMVVSGQSLSIILKSKFNHLFLDVALNCKTLILCRVSPLQKKEVVTLVKTNVIDAVTLAIGDGGNDCSMIQEADVGVGISGKEGMQAANVADFTISQFSFLKILLLEHGSTVLHRIAATFKFFMYKNFLIVLIMLFYNFYNMFSGEYLFSPITWVFFNSIYTALPPFAFGLEDRAVPYTSLIKFPILYKINQKMSSLDLKSVGWCVINSALHAILIFFITYYSFRSGVTSSHGIPITYEEFGFITYTMVIICITLRALYDIHTYSLINLLCILSTPIFWIISISIVCRPLIANLIDPFLIDVDVKMYQNELFWFSLLIPFIPLLPDYMYRVTNNYFFKTPTKLIKELQNSNYSLEDADTYDTIDKFVVDYNTSKKEHYKKYLGFAFSFHDNTTKKLNKLVKGTKTHQKLENSLPLKNTKFS